MSRSDDQVRRKRASLAPDVIWISSAFSVVYREETA
jgi:hypothetical protein